MSIITLTTDFGIKDEYVGVIKGVILRINAGATLVDISHLIPPQAVALAGEMLKATFAWFPAGTIHLAVVDPGVGSSRAILAARYDGHVFIAPDNGLLPVIWGGQVPQRLVQVQNSRFYLDPVSDTFHGRDIFAPVAAHIAAGIDLEEFGPELTPAQIRRIVTRQPQRRGDREIAGLITGADHFGNLRTNIDRGQLESLKARCRSGSLTFELGDHSINGLSPTYGLNERGRVIALINSRSQLEIAVVGGSAADLVKAFEGMTVRVRCSE